MFPELRMVAISTQGLAIPWPLAFFHSQAELFRTTHTEQDVLQILEFAFVKDMLFGCRQLKRVYLDSYAGMPIPHHAGFWTSSTDDNHGVPYTENTATVMSVRRMASHVAYERAYDFNSCIPKCIMNSPEEVSDPGDSREENEWNSAVKRDSFIHVVQSFDN